MLKNIMMYVTWIVVAGSIGSIVAICVGGCSASVDAQEAQVVQEVQTHETFSGIIKDVQMCPLGNTSSSLIIEFEDGRLLKTWWWDGRSIVFHKGKYNQVTVDLNCGGISSVKYQPGVMD